MAQKITACSLTIIAGTMVWREFGPRIYVVDLTNKKGTKRVDVLLEPTHPVFKTEALKQKCDELKSEGYYPVKIYRMD